MQPEPTKTSRRKIAVIVREPGQLPEGIDVARQLNGDDARVRLFFLCPECSSRRSCRVGPFGGDVAGDPECLADRPYECLPDGFAYADVDRIARLIRESDIVIPF